jgi:hypothetical protein
MNISYQRSYSHLQQEYEAHAALFNAQPSLVQRFFKEQALGISQAVLQNASLVHFQLPDSVNKLAEDGKTELISIPERYRRQMATSYIGWISQSYLDNALRHHLFELEQSNEVGPVLGARLLRYAIAVQLIYNELPSGRSVKYLSLEGEEIPSLPLKTPGDALTALVSRTDAITEDHPDDGERGELQVPYTTWARCFYIPAWVAFDEQARLLVGSNGQAEASLASMKNFVSVLQTAIDLAAYMVADPVYQQKRYGILGQLVNQGRCFARYQTDQIIAAIQRRAKANDLNRGLSLSLPYFDDQTLVIETHDFVIIPPGRVMFLPAFVVLAVEKERAKIAQDIRMTLSTRKHLLGNLKLLEQAFRN